ncbi:hypothetical protein BVY00_02165, partial [bacterium G20]
PDSLNALLEESAKGPSTRARLDQVADPKDEVEEATQAAEDAAVIEDLFAKKRGLTPKEKYVLSFRLGFVVDSLRGTEIDFGDGTVLPYEDIIEQMSDTEAKGYTLEEAGQLFGLTRERIRQIEKKGMDKIRNTYQRR